MAATQAVRRYQISPKRVSFADTLAWLRRTGVDTQSYDLIVNPIRPARIEPRVIKRHNDKYTWMTRPRRLLRQTLEKQAPAA